MSVQPNKRECIINGLIGAAIAIGIVILLGRTCEKFAFEVTPWKKTCLSNDPCPRCCARGYYGQGIDFDYTSDTDRMNQNCCSN